MRRIVLAAATATLVVGSAVVTAASPATAATALDDNASVCAAVQTTVTNGVNGVVPDLEQGQSKADSGDQAGAKASFQAAGTKFTDMGNQVLQIANTASDEKLKSAVTGFGNEVIGVGTALSNTSSLDSLDTSKADAAGAELASMCGGGSSPSPSGGAGSTPS